MGEKPVGKVTHYYGRIGVAAVTLSDALRVGDRIRVQGHTTDFTATVDRMQVNHADVAEAKPGDDVAVHVPERARANDVVYRIEG